jgi:hypothetical protein
MGVRHDYSQDRLRLNDSIRMVGEEGVNGFYCGYGRQSIKVTLCKAELCGMAHI